MKHNAKAFSYISLIGIVAILALTGLFTLSKTFSRQQKTPAENESAQKLQDRLEFSKYTKVEKTQQVEIDDNNTKFKFMLGQPEIPSHKNYELIYPNTWELFTYQNEQNRDIYGTNVLLKKGESYIRIKQQLYESGSCVFDEKDVKLMSYKCDLVQTLAAPHEDWKVFTVPNSSYLVDKKDPWTRYGVCDQDSYAQGISSYQTPDEYDKRVCSPWSNIGEIEYFTLSNTPLDFEEFVGIIETVTITQ